MTRRIRAPTPDFLALSLFLDSLFLGIAVLPVLIEDCEAGRDVSYLLPKEAPLVVALPDHLLGHDVG